ncbi:MAG: hypothetical protein WDO56_21110 [Gammaproteobacteria bacterium]
MIAIQEPSLDLSHPRAEVIVRQPSVGMFAALSHPTRQRVAGAQADNGVVDERLVLPREQPGLRILERLEAHHVGVGPDAAPLEQQSVTKPVGKRGEGLGAPVPENRGTGQDFRGIPQRDTGRHSRDLVIGVKMNRVPVPHK